LVTMVTDLNTLVTMVTDSGFCPGYQVC